MVIDFQKACQNNFMGKERSFLANGARATGYSYAKEWS